MDKGLDGADTQKIQELEGLITRRPVDRKRGPIGGEILKLLVFGDQQCPIDQVRIGGKREDLLDFVMGKKERNSRRRIT